MKRIRFICSLFLAVLAFTVVPAQSDGWSDLIGDPTEMQLAVDDAVVNVEVLGLDDYTSNIIENYRTPAEDATSAERWEKVGASTMMQIVGVPMPDKQGKHYYLQVIEDGGYGFLGIHNRSANTKGKLKRYIKRVVKWKTKDRGQRFAHWFNSQWVPSALYFTGYAGDGKPIDKLVHDAPLYLANWHIDRVQKGYGKHKVVQLE